MNHVPEVVSRAVGQIGLQLQKNRPHIFFGLGVAGMVTSTVLACKATLKLDTALTECHDQMQVVKNTVYTDDRARTKDMGRAYFDSSVKLARLYAPSAIVGAASVALLTTSHIEMVKRNSALTATVVSLSQLLDEYRERVRKEVGEDRERELYYNVKHLEVDGPDGKMSIATIDPNDLTLYARFFDEASSQWHKNAEYNKLFLRAQQNYCNDLLNARGHVFLNEVYDMLDIPRSQAGQVVGWVRGYGDSFVDFGVFEVYNSNFVNGGEPRILLDFNVSGVIYDKI